MVYLFQIGQHSFAEFVREINQYGIEVDPALELRKGQGMWCRYDITERQIYLSVPNTAEPAGKLYLLYLRSLLGCESNAEFMHLSEFLIPYFVAHELGHHLRHRYGQFSDNAWHEEQVANQFAIALNKHRLDIRERGNIARMVRRAVAGLAKRLDMSDEGIVSYRNLWEGLHTAGVLGPDEFNRLQFIQRLLSEDASSIATVDPQLEKTLQQHLQKRHNAIHQINTDYAEDMTRYLYYHLHWLALELENHEHEYVTTFAHDHLALQLPLLPKIPPPGKVDASMILACFKAHRETVAHSEVLGVYFYRRYLGLLLTLLQGRPARGNGGPKHAGGATGSSGSILQSYLLVEPNLLRAVAHHSHPADRELFPDNITAHPDLERAPVSALPTETDRRLFAHVRSVKGNRRPYDPAAVNTAELLQKLYRIAVFDSLPAEIWLELAHRFLTVKLHEGDSLIWKDDVNHDVYILIDGELAVFISADGAGRCVKRVQPGEIIGEIAFLSRQTRQATVRATKPSECLVLRDVDLRILSFKYPDILMTMGKVLAERLSHMNEAFRNLGSNASIGERQDRAGAHKERMQWQTSRP